MSGLQHYRKRSQTVCFWMSYDERRDLEARIVVCGLPKGEYFRQSLLHQRIEIAGGKYQSDRLSLEVKRLRETLEQAKDTVGTQEILTDCKAQLEQMTSIISKEET